MADKTETPKVYKRPSGLRKALIVVGLLARLRFGDATETLADGDTEN